MGDAFRVLQSESRMDTAGQVLLARVGYLLTLGTVFGAMGNGWRTKSLTRRVFEHVRTVGADSTGMAIDIIAREEDRTDDA